MPLPGCLKCICPFFLISSCLGIVLLSGCGSGSAAHQEPPPPVFPPATVPLVKLSSDPFTNASSQHATEVEPDTFAFGSTIVSAFQVGRIHDGGGADIGFATSSDGGTTWSRGFLPGITASQGSGTFSAASDASVAYDAAHGMWLISSLALSPSLNQVVVSRSPDGINWGNPIAITTSGNPDKNWIVCDNSTTSSFYGHCYVQWDDPSSANLMQMNTSSDGGLTWGPPLSTASLAHGIGGQPLVQPNGTVVVPFASGVFGSMAAFRSADGGATWSSTVAISPITEHQEAGNLRSAPLPTAEIDGEGKVYVVWADCRFRTNCTSNDLVLSTSSDGMTWTTPARVPIDPTTSTVDHFIPGLAVDPTTAGSTARLTLTYYYYPVSTCGSNCQVAVGFVSSSDGGETWTAPTELAGPMKVTWLPNTFSGLMLADYLSTSYVNGKAFTVFAVAKPTSGAVFDEAMYTTTNALGAAAGIAHFSSKTEGPVPNAKSDHPPRKFYDLDHEFPIPPRKRLFRRLLRR